MQSAVGLQRSRVQRPIVLWSAIVLALLLAHDFSHALDHGLETSLVALAAIAVPQWAFLAFLMSVIVRGERLRAAGAALLLGAGMVLGFALVHLVPFSPASYWDLHPTTLSWVLVWLPLAAGAVLTTLAWREWREALGRASG
jgi:hypothetical protein